MSNNSPEGAHVCLDGTQVREVEKPGAFTDGSEELEGLKKTCGLEQCHLPEAKDICRDSCGKHDSFRISESTRVGSLITACRWVLRRLAI